MSIITAYVTDKGRYRTKNQDDVICVSEYIGKKKVIVACVCDGIGSFEDGEISANIIIEGLDRWIKGIVNAYPQDCSEEELVEDLELTLTELNEIVYCLKTEKEVRTGCTMSLMLLIGYHYHIFQVGDSRIYSLNKSLQKMTFDEVVTREVNGKAKRLLSNYMGKNYKLSMVKDSGKLQDNTLLLVATDGFYKKVMEEDLLALKEIKGERKLFAECNNLIEKILNRGEKDNLSCVVILFNCT